MFRKLKVILQLLVLQLTAKSQGTDFEHLPFTNPLQTDFDSILHEQVKSFFKKSKAPGLIIGISQNGEKRYYSYGFADTSDKKPFTPTTIFEAGSITKTFTANLILQLHEQGTININNSLFSYTPGTTLNDSVLKKIILSDILSHTSGLPRLPSNLDKIKEYTLMQPYEFYKREHLWSFIKTIKDVNPGKYEYSNLGYGLLGTILENASGVSFELLLSNYIFEHLAMKNSYIATKKSQVDSATGYLYGKPAAYWHFDCLAGAGAIKSNAEDMLKYLNAHLFPGNDKLSKAVKKVTLPVKTVGPNIQICYAWHTMDNLKHPIFWHNGGTYGFSTFAGFEPATKTTIILASNSSSVNAPLDKLATDLLILLTGK